MYIPKHTRIDSTDEIYNFIEKNNFAILVTTNNGKLNASHIPVLLEKNENSRGHLLCHIAKANSQWKDPDKEVLVIFPGPHHYISSSWYETNQSVPTWNYLSVHVHGEIEIIDDREQKIKIIKDLVKYFESNDSLYKVEDLKQSYFDGLLNGIVAFKINITKLEGKHKLSQNHSEERRTKVVAELDKFENDKDAQIISTLMKKDLQNKTES